MSRGAKNESKRIESQSSHVPSRPGGWSPQSTMASRVVLASRMSPSRLSRPSQIAAATLTAMMPDRSVARIQCGVYTNTLSYNTPPSTRPPPQPRNGTPAEHVACSHSPLELHFCMNTHTHTSTRTQAVRREGKHAQQHEHHSTRGCAGSRRSDDSVWALLRGAASVDLAQCGAPFVHNHTRKPPQETWRPRVWRTVSVCPGPRGVPGRH